MPRLLEISADADMRGRLIREGHTAAQKYNWETSARRMLDVLAEAPYRFKYGHAQSARPTARRASASSSALFTAANPRI